MKTVYITSRENYNRINEKDSFFPPKDGTHLPHRMWCGTYKGKPLFFTDNENEPMLIKDIKRVEEVEMVKI